MSAPNGTTGVPEPSPRAEGGAARRTRARRPSPSAVLPPLLAGAALLIGWQVVSTAGLVPTNLLPSPARIAEQSWVQRDALLTHARATLDATLSGFAFSVVLSFLIAAAVDFSSLLRRAVLPLLIVSQTLPIVAIAPLMIVWFGFGLLPKVLIVALVTFFPMVVAWLHGFDSAPAESDRLLRSMGAGRRRLFWNLRLPGALPHFFAGLRIAVTYAVVAAIFAEYAGAVRGLGVYMQASKSAFRTDLVLAAVAVSSVLTLVLFALVLLVERLALPWLRIERGAAR